MIPTYSRLKKKYMEEKIMNSMKESLLSFSGANVPIDEVAKIMKKRSAIHQAWFTRKMVTNRYCLSNE